MSSLSDNGSLTGPDGIPCRVRVSSRAKHARLRMSPYDGLEVVVPEGFDIAGVASLLERYEGWIRRASERFERHRPAPDEPHSGGIPASVEMPAFGERWEVAFADDGCGLGIVGREGGGRILLPSGIAAPKGRAMLRDWVRLHARRLLLPHLDAVASSGGFSYASAGVRLQRSRWGSCSGRGRISLNVKLLFLPLELVHYIMLHELCHTVHMNHSQDFWRLVAHHDPAAGEHDRAMRTAWKYVPAWLVEVP